MLGALADARTVLLVARKRYEPLRRLPPLRNETLQLLAAVKASAISQSYERNMWLSGRTGDGFDRAPIYLSNELRNTEYGSLLNIVDQLLKGWSEGGQVAYKDFPYPKPRSYPFDPIRASETAADQQQAFLFNWNTEGVFYASTVDGVEIAAAYRTGSLPVIYGSIENRRLETEAKGTSGSATAETPTSRASSSTRRCSRCSSATELPAIGSMVSTRAIRWPRSTSLRRGSAWPSKPT